VIGYAASRIFVTKGDNGKTRFYASEIVGNIGVVAVTSLYYTSTQTPGQGALRYGMQLGNDAVTNVLTEFWPDIRVPHAIPAALSAAALGERDHLHPSPPRK
jgi:hypothetical protein